MKKLLVASVALLGLGFSVSALSEGTKVRITEKPVMLKKEGSVYTAPAGSAKYYTYTETGTDYVCTAETVSAVGVSPTSLELRVGDQMRTVKCYPSSTFTIEAQ